MLDLHVVAHHTLLGVSPSVWMSRNVKPPPPVFSSLGAEGPSWERCLFFSSSDICLWGKSLKNRTILASAGGGSRCFL